MTGASPRLRSVRTAALVATAAACLGLAACGDGPSSEGTASGSADGAAVYAGSCATCHGDDLGGTDQGPPLRSIVYEPGHHPDRAFRSAIAQGAPQHHWDFGGMPAVPGLDEAEVDAVIAHVRAEQERLGFIE